MSDNVAVDGFDVVSYFEKSGPRAGSSRFSFDWEGRTWQFASEGNRDRFAADPERYAPRFGGRCAFAMSLGKDQPGSPKHGVVQRGRLYLQSNPVAGLLFRLVPGRADVADRKWRERGGS